jgi:protein ImuB
LVSPPERFLEQTEFEREIETIEPLLFILRRFVEQLSRRLEMIYLTAVEFQLRLGLSSGAACERDFKIPSPTNNVEIIFRMLQTHLETLRTDWPIDSLRLEAKPAKPNARQLGLFEPTLRNPNQFGETMGRLTGLVGSENVGSPELEGTHKPDSFRMMPPNFDSATTTTKSGASTVVICGLRLRRFRPPLPARFEFRQEKPALIRSDVFSGALAAARGPYFGSGNWWEGGRWAREEWDVETAGGALLRIFRSSDGCFVEGVYD